MGTTRRTRQRTRRSRQRTRGIGRRTRQRRRRRTKGKMDAAAISQVVEEMKLENPNMTHDQCKVAVEVAVEALGDPEREREALREALKKEQIGWEKEANKEARLSQSMRDFRDRKKTGKRKDKHLYKKVEER